jgi:aldehyde dehydrogenase (NAD+)
VDETANIAHAATRIVWGKFINAGQTCVAPDHVFVHETRRDELLEKAAAVVRRFYGETDDQRALTRDFCRLVDDKSVHRLSAMLEASVAKGARVVIGGRTEAKERFIAPTILADVRTDSPSMKEEIFGPILPVLTYRAREEIYEFTRSRGQPLALYVFSRSRKAIDELVANIPSGGACINNTVIHLANSNLPFGGVGDSGLGNYHGHFGFKALSHERGVMVQGAPALIGQFYPPYHKNIDRLLQVANRVVS